MAIPKLTKQNILDALAYIDQNGVPDHNTSAKYELLTKEGKKYPPKYIIAVANHIANGTDIITQGYNEVEAKNFLKSRGFSIETKQEKYQLTITKDQVSSNDANFTMDNLALGDNYKPLDTYFRKGSGEVIKRKYDKGEQKISNQTMPRIACQIFQKQLSSLSVEEKENFPICQYTPSSKMIRGIFLSEEAYKKYHNSISQFNRVYEI